MLQHGSCAAREVLGTWRGVLLLGPPGSGKSSLLLRLLGRGWRLVADDQVRLTAVPGGIEAAAPEALRGLLEARGLGIAEGLDHLPRVPLALAAALVPRDMVPRLPAPASWEVLDRGLPRIALHGHDADAPERLALALDALAGAVRLRAGFLGERG